MKILLADCYHDSDKGGGGMIAGAISAIRSVCFSHNTNAEISLLYRFSEDDPKFQSAARLTSKSFPGLSILPAPLSSRRGPGIHWVTFILKITIIGSIRMLMPKFSKHPAILAMRNADFILFKGGNFYRSWSDSVFADFIAMILLFYTPILALRLGTPFSFSSHTFGPFKTQIAKAIVRWIVSKAAYVSTRETKSKEILIECGLPKDIIDIAPDFGFGAYPANATISANILSRHNLKPQNYVAFTARPWFYDQLRTGDESSYQRYITAAADLLDHTVSLGATRVALVVQNDGAHSKNEPDLPVLQSIKNRMKNKDKVAMLTEDFTFDDLCSVYHNAILVLGTRLHSCIFSFASGTPAIAIAYSHKAEGIMKMMEMGDYILDIHNVSITEGERMIERIFRDRKILSGNIAEKIPTLRKRLEESVAQAIFFH